MCLSLKSSRMLEKAIPKKKEEELADLQAKAQSATASQMSSLSDANKSMEEAAKADNRTDAAETKKDQTQKAENTQENADTATDASENADVKTETAETIKKSSIRKWTVGSIYTDRYTFIVRKGGWCYVRNQKF